MKVKQLSSEQIGVVKGVLGTSLVFSIGIAIGAFFVHQRHEDELDKLEQDTAKFCLDWAAEHYERSIRRKRKETEEVSDDNRETGRGYSAMTGHEATPEEWEALEKRLEQSCAEYEKGVQEFAEAEAEYRASLNELGAELDKLRAQIYAKNDRLNKCIANSNKNEAG